MMFPLRQDYLGPFTANTLGSIVQREITREFLISSIFIVAQATLTDPAATDSVDGALNLIKRVTLNVTDGARTRNVVDCSGVGLIEYASKIKGIDQATAMAAHSALADNDVLQVTYPIYFAHPQMQDPERSMFLLPCNRFTTNPLLTIYFGAQSDLDINAAPTLTITGGITYFVIINRFQVGVENWPIFDTELVEQTVSYPSSGANQIFELPTPGSYTAIMIRGYSGAATALTRNWNLIANGDYRLAVLGTNLRRVQGFMTELDNESTSNRWGQTLGEPFGANVNQAWTGSVGGVGCLMFDFLSDFDGNSVIHADFGSVLDTNGLIKTGARAQIIGDIAGGTGVQNKYLWHRIFGDLSSLKAALKAA